MTKTQTRILVVEDESIVAKNIQNRLQGFGYVVPAIASNGAKAIEKAAEVHPDLVLMDIMLNGKMDGIEAARHIQEQHNIPVVYLTAFADDKTLQRAKITKPFGYILKPFEPKELRTTIEIALYNHNIERKLKEAQERQAQLLKELEQANQELNDFAHIIAHDLKSPLLTIGSLAEWLSTDFADKLNGDGKEVLNLLIDKIEQTKHLTDSILKFLKVDYIKGELIEIDLNSLMTEIIDIITLPENIEIKIANQLPLILCEKTGIQQVFQNLIRNAVKFMDKPQGKISINCTEDLDYWKICVADNGSGIEVKHFEKIFQMFQTISGVNTLESTGVGLAIAKKIIEKYGGKIWVESIIGEGSTFFFTLPKVKKQAA